jgi:hypothetical protein
MDPEKREQLLEPMEASLPPACIPKNHASWVSICTPETMHLKCHAMRSVVPSLVVIRTVTLRDAKTGIKDRYEPGM